MSSTYSTGLFSEWVARWYLRLRGWQILESRYITGRYTGRAEIDIIACRGNIMIFIEVKNRKQAEQAVRAVTTTQRTRLKKAAIAYMSRCGWQGDARFDIMIVRGLRVIWLRGAISGG